ncbi:hypothetical protein [Tenuifilum osseticum]|uniref:hypothetical protein n=1 Tax=Tenuifilum osseticum TaxID=3374723 RepID=UPI0034E59CB2
MKRILYLSVILFCFCSCSSGQHKDNKFIEHPVEDFIIPDSLFDFFPKQAENAKAIFFINNAGATDLPYSNEEFAITFVLKAYEYLDTTNFTNITTDFSRMAINKYSVRKDNYFIVGSERDMLERFDTLYIKEQYLSKTNSLVMNFHGILNSEPNFYDSTTLCGLPPDYEILILKQGHQYVLPEKYKTEWYLMPDNIKHGYLSGIACSKIKHQIIYWAATW